MWKMESLQTFRAAGGLKTKRETKSRLDTAEETIADPEDTGHVCPTWNTEMTPEVPLCWLSIYCLSFKFTFWAAVCQ